MHILTFIFIIQQQFYRAIYGGRFDANERWEKKYLFYFETNGLHPKQSLFFFGANGRCP